MNDEPPSDAHCSVASPSIDTVHSFSTCRIEFIVDNRVNRSTLSTNGIRNAVSLQPVLYIGGIPNSNNINLTGFGLNSHGFQGCLSSFIVDGRLLDYQHALVLNGQVKMNVCSGTAKAPGALIRLAEERKHHRHANNLL
jgi:hypothetical protein